MTDPLIAQMEETWLAFIREPARENIEILCANRIHFWFKRMDATASNWWAKPSGGKMTRRLNRKRIAYGH
jgi:hypothetical protein